MEGYYSEFHKREGRYQQSHPGVPLWMYGGEEGYHKRTAELQIDAKLSKEEERQRRADVYIDNYVLDRGMDPELIRNESYMIRIRRLHRRELSRPEAASFYGVYYELYSKALQGEDEQESVQAASEEVELVVSDVVDAVAISVVVGVDAVEEVPQDQEETEEKEEEEDDQGEEIAEGSGEETGQGIKDEKFSKFGRIVFPDRFYEDPKIMQWVQQFARKDAAERLEKALAVKCKCVERICRGGDPMVIGDERLWTTQQRRVLGDVVRGPLVPGSLFRGQCLLCVRHEFYTSLHHETWQLDPRVWTIIRAYEEYEVVVETRRELAEPLNHIEVKFATTNDEKFVLMSQYMKELAPNCFLSRVNREDREIQGDFGEILDDKLKGQGPMVIVDDAGFMDECGYPGPYAKHIYHQRPDIQGDQVAVVTMAMDLPDSRLRWADPIRIKAMGTQLFEAGPTPENSPAEREYREKLRFLDQFIPDRGDWRDLIYPFGVKGGRLEEMPLVVSWWGDARFRCLRNLLRSVGWLF